MKTITLAKILKMHEAGNVLFETPSHPPSELLEQDSVSQALAVKWQALIFANEALQLAKSELNSAIEVARKEVSKIPSQARTSMEATFDPSEFEHDSVKSSQAVAISLHVNAMNLYPDCIWNNKLLQHEFSDGSIIKQERIGFAMIYKIEYA